MKNYIYLIVLIGVIALQIFLSLKKNKLGLILPIITLCFSVIVPIVATPVSSIQEMEVQVFSESGEKIEHDSTQQTTELLNVSTQKTTIFYSFLLYNIFTAILFAIYIVCKTRKNKNLNLMRAHDLE